MANALHKSTAMKLEKNLTFRVSKAQWDYLVKISNNEVSRYIRSLIDKDMNPPYIPSPGDHHEVGTTPVIPTITGPGTGDPLPVHPVITSSDRPRRPQLDKSAPIGDILKEEPSPSDQQGFSIAGD